MNYEYEYRDLLEIVKNTAELFSAKKEHSRCGDTFSLLKIKNIEKEVVKLIKNWQDNQPKVECNEKQINMFDAEGFIQ